jgi:hypothetical protein
VDKSLNPASSAMVEIGSQEMKGTHRDFGRQLLQRQRLITLRLYPAQGFCDTPLVPMTRRVRELFSPSR